LPGRNEPFPVSPFDDNLGNARNFRGDDRHTRAHRQNHRQRQALSQSDGMTNTSIAASRVAKVASGAEEVDPRRDAEVAYLRIQRLTQLAVADDDEVKAGECGRRHRLKRKLWPFCFGQPRDRAGDCCIRLKTKRHAHLLA